MGRAPVVVLAGLVQVLLLVLTACSSAPATTGLAVTVSGVPSGVAGNVVVTGPGGYAHTVTSSTTLSGLAPGTYSLAVHAVSNGNAIVRTVYDGGASHLSVTVTEDTTAFATVSYALRVGSGNLWVPLNPTYEAAAYTADSLAASGSPSPGVSLSTSSNRGQAVAFDGVGNMWVADCRGYVYRYDTAQLASTGSPTPAVTIDATAYSCLAGLAFDASGDLWVSSYNTAQVLEYTPAQLAAGGALTPAVIISADAMTSLSYPAGLAFDAFGDLWVTDSNISKLVAFAPSQIVGSGSPTPAVTLSSSAGSIWAPHNVAFDASGSLWVTNAGNATVVRFDASQLASSGSPTPAATIASGSFASGARPVGVAFDASGALWVADSSALQLRRFANPGSLTGTVTLTPDVIISSLASIDNTQIGFSPPPANVPINTP